MDGSDSRAFAGFELNLRTGELIHAGEIVPLERQPAVVLVQLVANAGHLVPREDLRRAVWGDATHVDFDRGLNYCLRQIRVALGDDARAPRFVETVPRQGYRFIAPIDTPSRSPVRRKGRFAIAATVLAAAGALIAIEAGPRNETHHQIAVSVVRAVHDFLF
jgi:DNA-binding winged helix-turn-helix (wHTH) protein